MAATDAAMDKYKRRDWVLGPVHVIRRGYREDSQYGILLWGTTLDIWIKNTLWTIRKDKRYE